MTRHSQTAYSYRSDTQVPRFDDSGPLFVFDGHCGLCSGGVRWLMRIDWRRRIAFTSAQGDLGAALYRHYGVAVDTTYLLIADGHAWGMSGGYLRLTRTLGGVWSVFRIAAVIPESWRDRAYRVLARNRYRWFGVHDHCALLNDDQRSRLL